MMSAEEIRVDGGPLITYTIFPDVYPKKATERADVPWHELVAKIYDAPTYISKRHCPLISMAAYGNRLSDKGYIRHADNVLRVYGVEIDYDGEEVTPEEGARRLSAADLQGIIYTSPSHTDSAPRWRALLPLAEPATPEQRAFFCARANRALGGIATRESFTLSQSFYIGRVRGAVYRVTETSGRTIDVAADLEPLYFTGYNDGASQTDFRTDDDLRKAFENGTDRYQAMLKLSARWAARGMACDDIMAALYALLGEGCRALNADGIDLRTRVEPMATSAVAKFGGHRAFYEGSCDGPLPPEHDLPPVEVYGSDPAVIEADEITPPAATIHPVIPFDLWAKTAPVPPLPRGILPETIESLALAKPETFPPAALAAAALTACSMASSDHLKVEININWRERFTIWTGLVGSSASGKSPTMGAALRPIAAIQTEAHEIYEQQMREYRARKKGTKKGEDFDEEPPVCERYLTHNATIEALTELERQTEHGLGLIHDELSALIAAMDGAYKEKSGGERGHWLALYDGGPHTTDRIGRGSVFVKNHSASILGGITLDKLRALVANMSADGLMARIGIVMMPTTEPSDDMEAIPYETWKGYESLVQRIARNRPYKSTTVQMEPAARSLLGAAKKRWQAEALRQAENLPRYSERLGKLPGLAARFALGFALIEAAELPGHHAAAFDLPRTIHEGHMKRAIDWVTYQSTHDLAFYAGAGERETVAGMGMARKVAAWFLRHQKAEFKLGDVTRGILEWRSLKSNEQAGVMELLEQLGWVVAHTPDNGPAYRGQSFMRGVRWVVNPHAHASFAARAEHERLVAAEARQKLKEAVNANGEC